MSVDDLQRIKRWHLTHRDDHPVEYVVFDAMLTLWVAGWVGWVPVYACDLIWALPICVLAMAAPSLYVTWRMKAHRAGRLRCDWMMTTTAIGR